MNDETAWRDALASLQGAYAPATLKAYRADFALFDSWCRLAGVPALPASPGALAGFLTARAVEDRLSTILRRLSAIKKVHRVLRLAFLGDDEEVRTAYRRVARSQRRRPAQAHGLTIALRERLIDACNAETIAGVRDRALIAVGYDTLCRRSELVALRVADLVHDGSDVSAFVSRSKADPFGDGRLAFLTPRSVTLLDAWLRSAGIEDGPLFRSLTNGRIGKGNLDPGSVGRILKRAARAAGFAPSIVAQISGHSMRVGGAQDMAAADFDIGAVMIAGGWKTVAVVSRYVEKAQVVRVGRLRENRVAAAFKSAQSGQ